MQGLRRAFRGAGARSLVMTLWAVSDAETSELMAELYRAWRGGRTEPHLALRQARLARLAALRRTRGEPAPWAWAGVVAVGR